MFIGNDLLPNVYINNIEVYDNKVRYDIFIIDSESSPTWSKKKSLTHTLRLKHIVTEDVEERRLISTGVSTFGKYHDKAVVHLVSEMHKATAENVLDMEDRIFFIRTYEYTLTSGTKNVSIFANLFIDGIIEEGPIAAEDVYVNGNIRDSANSFSKNGSPYYGAVHEHQNVYMEGKKHSSRPHSVIDVVTVPNLKIKDFRRRIYPEKVGQVDNKVPLFSNMFVSYDEETNHNFMFFINLKEIIIQKTKYGRFLSVIDKDMEEELLNTTLFRSIRIKRHKLPNRINENSKTHKIVETKTISVGYETQLDPTQNYVSLQGGRARFISQTFGSSLRAFMFSDKTANDRTHGNFQYEIELSFVDQTRDFLLNMVANVSRYISIIENFITLIGTGDRYDHKLNKIKNTIRESTFFRNQEHIAIAAYFNDLKFLMYDMEDTDRKKDLVRNYNLLNPETCTIASLSLFLNESKKLYRKFLTYCDFDSNLIKANNQTEFMPTNKEFHNRIVFNHRFKNIVKPTDSKYQYEIPKTQQTSTTTESVQSETVNPTGFGARGRQVKFGTPEHQKSFSSQVFEAKESKFTGKNKLGALSILPNIDFIMTEKEKFKNITDYLGSDTKMNSFTTEEKCEPTEKQTIVVSEIETQVLTGATDIQREMRSVTIQTELLEGFAQTTTGKMLLTQPIWNSSYEYRGTAIIKQNQINANTEETNYSYPNRYLLINNGKHHIVRNEEGSSSRLMLQEINNQGISVNSFFTQTIIVENYDSQATTEGPPELPSISNRSQLTGTTPASPQAPAAAPAAAPSTSGQGSVMTTTVSTMTTSTGGSY